MLELVWHNFWNCRKIKLFCNLLTLKCVVFIHKLTTNCRMYINMYQNHHMGLLLVIICSKYCLLPWKIRLIIWRPCLLSLVICLYILFFHVYNFWCRFISNTQLVTSMTSVICMRAFSTSFLLNWNVFSDVQPFHYQIVVWWNVKTQKCIYFEGIWSFEDSRSPTVCLGIGF